MSPRKRTGEVLTWGCQTTGRLVRGRLAPGTEIPNETMTNSVEVAVACPCGEEHRVGAMTRPRRPGETFDVDPVELRSLPRRRGH